MSLHLFRKDDGEVYVYPPFVAYANGYDIIVWSDETARQTERTERHARRVAEQKWADTHGGEHTEKRWEENQYVPAGVSKMVRVTFVAKPHGTLDVIGKSVQSSF